MSTISDRLRAIADEVDMLLRGPVALPPQDAAARYLAENPDVAKHIYYGRHPLEHWQMHGQKEGRRWPAVPVPEPVVPRVDEPHADDEAPQPTVSTDSPALRNFAHIKATLGDDAAYDYLIKNVEGGAELVRGMFADRVESARIVNKYGIGVARGRVEGDEYVYAAPFTDGKRVKLPG